MFLRVNSGNLKGKKIELPSKDTTRSTKSLVKKSLFDTIHYNVIDREFVEVFSGSGSIGIEAVSRGATISYFIEKDRESYTILSKNCQNIIPNNSKIYLGDSFEVLPTIYKQLKSKAIFYFDPPFAIRDGFDNIYDDIISLIETIPLNLIELIIIEHQTKHNIREPNNLKLQKSKKFGNTTLSYYNVN
jgi:16S rRNA (guanine(966)-N(2))-methyltransferase RsmD